MTRNDYHDLDDSDASVPAAASCARAPAQAKAHPGPRHGPAAAGRISYLPNLTHLFIRLLPLLWNHLVPPAEETKLCSTVVSTNAILYHRSGQPIRKGRRRWAGVGRPLGIGTKSVIVCAVRTDPVACCNIFYCTQPPHADVTKLLCPHH